MLWFYRTGNNRIPAPPQYVALRGWGEFARMNETQHLIPVILGNEHEIDWI